MRRPQPSARLDPEQLSSLAAVLEKILAPGAPEVAHAPDDEFDSARWSELADAGLIELTGPDDSGGGGWPEAALVPRSSGKNVARVPYAQHDLLAGWLLDAAGLPRLPGPVRVPAVFRAGCGEAAVPWARHASTAVALFEVGRNGRPAWHVAEMPLADFTVGRDTNVAGEPVDVLTCKRDPPPSIPLDGDVIDELRSRAALASVLLMAGTAERVLDLVIAHATARAQFGRPISRFQAVQHMISDAAAEVSLIDVAADAAVCAVEELGWGHPRTRFAIAAAVSGAGHAVDPVVRNAHQVLGAIGCAREHPLHRYTNRLLARRSENGSVRSWDMAVLRSAVHQAGSPGLWPWLVDGAGPGGTRRP